MVAVRDGEESWLEVNGQCRNWTFSDFPSKCGHHKLLFLSHGPISDMLDCESCEETLPYVLEIGVTSLRHRCSHWGPFSPEE